MKKMLATALIMTISASSHAATPYDVAKRMANELRKDIGYSSNGWLVTGGRQDGTMVTLTLQGDVDAKEYNQYILDLGYSSFQHYKKEITEGLRYSWCTELGFGNDINRGVTVRILYTGRSNIILSQHIVNRC